jgi:hypothetical protein
VVPGFRLAIGALNVRDLSAGPTVRVGVVRPNPSDASPNSKWTSTAAPLGLTEPRRRAEVLVRRSGWRLWTFVGWEALPSSLRGAVPFVSRKNGVPIAPPWHAAPS